MDGSKKYIYIKYTESADKQILEYWKLYLLPFYTTNYEIVNLGWDLKDTYNLFLFLWPSNRAFPNVNQMF